jgi:hypothetical protein
MLKPLAMRGMTVPMGKNASVARPPQTACAMRAFRLEPPVEPAPAEVEDESVSVELVGLELVHFAASERENDPE